MQLTQLHEWYSAENANGLPREIFYVIVNKFEYY